MLWPPTLLPLLPLLLLPIRLLQSVARALGMPVPSAVSALQTHCYYSADKARKALGYSPVAAKSGLHAAMLSVRARGGLPLRLVAPLTAFALTLSADASGDYPLPACAFGAALSLGALLYAFVPPPKALPAQGAIAPPVVSGGLPLMGHLLAFMRGPVSMFDGLRQRYRSIFTIRVGPQRITMMVGQRPAPSSNKRTRCSTRRPCMDSIPVFGKGIIYDSPLDERLQQVKLLVHSMNTKSLENMVPKMINEAESYFKAWSNGGPSSAKVSLS